jgi:hypothetical protein
MISLPCCLLTANLAWIRAATQSAPERRAVSHRDQNGFKFFHGNRQAVCLQGSDVDLDRIANAGDSLGLER